MPSAASARTEVFNQSPPFEDVNLFALDRPLMEAVAGNGGASASAELTEFGKHWGSAAMAQRGRLANENTPKLKTFDARGFRRDEVEFHPAYHCTHDGGSSHPGRGDRNGVDGPRPRDVGFIRELRQFLWPAIISGSWRFAAD